MRDHAVRCGVRTYLALPVFEPIGKKCVGVIELVTVWKGGYLTYEVEKVLNALEVRPISLFVAFVWIQI